MSRPYVHGTGATEDPLRYEITEEFLQDLESGHWESGMPDAAAKEIRRLREENKKTLALLRATSDSLYRAWDHIAGGP